MRGSKAVMLRPDAFEEAPTGPGIYAWYLDVRAYPPTRASENPGLFMQDLNRRHALIDPATKIVLKSSENFGFFWFADVRLQTTHSSHRARDLDFDDDQITAPTRWKAEDDGSEVDPSTEPNELQASLLAQTLADVFPFFSSPLYIGTSKNIQTRLMQHRKLFEDLYSARENYRANLDDGKVWKQFAHRCVGQDLRLDDLIVFAKEMDDPIPHDGEEPFRTAREIAERFLNLISRPMFGMR